MMGKTHRVGGAVAMLVSFTYMQKHGLTVENINPLVQLLVMYPCCMWGSVAPDLDQNDEAIPVKAPVSIMIHKLLYLGKVRHRSWQTHCLTTVGCFVALLFLSLRLISERGVLHIDPTAAILLRLMLMGLAVGIASHLFLDMMTYDGIPLIPPTKVKGKRVRHNIRLVPHTDAFKTNTPYETGVRVVLSVFGIIYAVWMIYSVIVPYFMLV